MDFRTFLIIIGVKVVETLIRFAVDPYSTYLPFFCITISYFFLLYIIFIVRKGEWKILLCCWLFYFVSFIFFVAGELYITGLGFFFVIVFYCFMLLFLFSKQFFKFFITLCFSESSFIKKIFILFFFIILSTDIAFAWFWLICMSTHSYIVSHVDLLPAWGLEYFVFNPSPPNTLWAFLLYTLFVFGLVMSSWVYLSFKGFFYLLKFFNSCLDVNYMKTNPIFISTFSNLQKNFPFLKFWYYLFLFIFFIIFCTILLLYCAIAIVGF